MSVSLTFVRIFFVLLSIFFMTAYTVAGQNAYPISASIIGIGLGTALSLLLIGFDVIFRRFNIRSFNIALVGLFIGYLMGKALLLIFNEVAMMGHFSQTVSPETLEIIKIGIFLFATYLGTLMTLRAADQFYVSIPFVRFVSKMHKKKDFLLDISALHDPRIYDLATTGILDEQLVVPQFVIKELYAQAESHDEVILNKARKILETYKRLQSLESLSIRYNETDFPEANDLQTKMLKLARLLDSHILTADTSRLQSAGTESVKVININNLATALKPMMQAGEHIRIKVQRIGKEPRQGVGYLEDGTMVVVNGGGHFLGDIVDARVLSVKHTSSGRMIFCNVLDEELSEKQEVFEALDER